MSAVFSKRKTGASFLLEPGAGFKVPAGVPYVSRVFDTGPQEARIWLLGVESRPRLWTQLIPLCDLNR